ncbi:diguanylate cyclase domain-containing protein [Bowmanella yangjiangensis]|uniref:Diguanylate cyclase n=1 Tax=Bowmanella yangjiangensis TaxID=2811230 RepID=A0ABS3CYY4_9ALTE|nr:diguanylate cyclase [Bowmanella yangjiangensis]MBN7821606.1 diguanylate cyclase [Bowmanella yangjiangensis]
MTKGALRLICLLGSVTLAWSGTLHAASTADGLVRSLQADNYECPTDEQAAQIEEHLSYNSLPRSKLFYLQVRKAQYLACGGKLEEASELLEQMLNEPPPNEGSENLAYALYLAGIVTSGSHSQERCDYYRAAEQEALRVDSQSILLGAQLELTSTCDIDEQHIDKSLAKLYALLERYSAAEDQAVRSDIFNNIGNLYALIGQHELAGDQYIKSYQMSQGVYQGETLLMPLFNAINAYLHSGRLEQANQALSELIKQNSQVNTALSNAWVQQAQAGYAFYQGNQQLLKDSLARWAVFLPDLSHPDMDTIYRRMQAEACLVDLDLRCLRDYIALEVPQRPYQLSEDLAYLRLLVNSYHVLGQSDAAYAVFKRYDQVSQRLFETQQSSSKILGVAQMLSDIVALESSLEQIKKKEAVATMRLVAALSVVAALLGLLAWLFYRRRRVERQRDQHTGLLTGGAAMDKLKGFTRPSVLRVHAISLIEIDGLDGINLSHGPGSIEKVLRQVADKLRQACRVGDVIGRMGSQEFLVCLNDIDEIRAKEHMEGLISSLIQSAFETASGQTVNLQVRYSLMILDEALDDVVALYQGLVQAMAQEKRMQGAQPVLT